MFVTRYFVQMLLKESFYFSCNIALLSGIIFLLAEFSSSSSSCLNYPTTHILYMTSGRMSALAAQKIQADLTCSYVYVIGISGQSLQYLGR